MTEILEQQFYVFSLSRRYDDLNELLDEGFEVADITPVQSKTGGAMFRKAHWSLHKRCHPTSKQNRSQNQIVHEMVIRVKPL
jgi:hypothetical protein